MYNLIAARSEHLPLEFTTSGMFWLGNGTTHFVMIAIPIYLQITHL